MIAWPSFRPPGHNCWNSVQGSCWISCNSFCISISGKECNRKTLKKTSWPLLLFFSCNSCNFHAFVESRIESNLMLESTKDNKDFVLQFWMENSCAVLSKKIYLGKGEETKMIKYQHWLVCSLSNLAVLYPSNWINKCHIMPNKWQWFMQICKSAKFQNFISLLVNVIWVWPKYDPKITL